MGKSLTPTDAGKSDGENQDAPTVSQCDTGTAKRTQHSPNNDTDFIKIRFKEIRGDIPNLKNKNGTRSRIAGRIWERLNEIRERGTISVQSHLVTSFDKYMAEEGYPTLEEHGFPYPHKFYLQELEPTV